MLLGASAEHRRALPLPSRLWHATRPLLCRTSAPILCRVVVSLCPPCLALHFSAILDWLSEPSISPGLCRLSWGWLCSVSHLHLLGRGGRRGQGQAVVGDLCAMAGLLFHCDAPCPTLGSRAGKSLMSAGLPQRPAMEGRPIYPLAALHPVLGTSVSPCRHVVSGWQVEDVLLGQSCFFLRDAPAWQREVAAASSLASFAIPLSTAE